MIDLVAALQTHLAAAGTALIDVADAATLADLVARDIAPPRVPAAYVVDLGGSAPPSPRATGVVDQEVTANLGVVVVTRASGDAAGGKGRVSIDALRIQVIEALHGWSADGDHTPLELSGYQLLGMPRGHIWLQVDFTTAFHVRS